MSASEKAALPIPIAPPPPRPPKKGSRVINLGLLPALLLTSWLFKDVLINGFTELRPAVSRFSNLGAGCSHYASSLAPATCPSQPPALNVGNDWNPHAESAYAKLAANRLSAAIQHDTESFDDLPEDPTDPRWEKFNAFDDFLLAEFPTVFDEVEHEIINTHGHLVTWQGSNPDLEPILLMAHTDVVPVLEDTRNDWTFGPFEGKITHNHSPETRGTWVWGRGASDCKNTLMGIYGAIEKLVQDGWKPERTILVANGFDEEIGGPRGAQKIATVLESRYPKVAFLVDEGLLGVTYGYGKTIVNLGMGEKGAMNLIVRVETPGGHSSQPERHTGIGVMSDILYHLESNPFKPHLSPEEPYLKYLTCLSEHAPEFPKHYKKQVQNPRMWPKLAEELAEGKYWFSCLATTQAIDVIRGGLKSNALPEFVESTINYRISFTSSIAEATAHVVDIVKPIAHRLNFTFSAFENAHGEPGKKKSNHHIDIRFKSGVDNGKSMALEPAPMTQGDTASWGLMAGTSKHVFGEDALVTPTGMFANTDTKWFWNLTNNIYRFNPCATAEDKNAHTVDERISLEGHLNATRWYYTLMQNSVGWEAD